MKDSAVANVPDLSEIRVWYLAYGSNMSGDRFSRYIRGGRAKGSALGNQGCRDKQLPPCMTGASPVKRAVILHRLYFSHYSNFWNHGGLAFIEDQPIEGARVYCRLYSVTAQQLADLWAQENGDSISESSVLAEYESAVRSSLGAFQDKVTFVDLPKQARYGRMLCLGRERADESSPAIPLLTLTETDEMRIGARVPPNERYLANITRGILETYPDIDPETEVYEYLMSFALCNQRQARLAITEAYNMAVIDRAPAAEISEPVTPDVLVAIGKGVAPDSMEQPSAKIPTTFFEVLPTRDRTRGCGDYIVRMSESSLQNRGGYVRLTSYHEEWDEGSSDPHPISIVARLDPEPSVTCDAHCIELDHTLRQALGVAKRRRFRTMADQGTPDLPGDYVEVEDFSLPLRVRLIKWLHQILETPVLIARVQRAAHVDMELEVCRLPMDALRLLGVGSGDFAVLESEAVQEAFRVLPITTSIALERERTMMDRSHIDLRRALKLRRLGFAGQDLPAIFLDGEARERLGVGVGDPVRVRRSLIDQFWKRINTLLVPVTIGLVLGVPKLIADWDDMDASAANTILALIIIAFLSVVALVLGAFRNNVSGRLADPFEGV